MYAIVETGGKQYRVQPGDTIAVERLVAEPGAVLDLDRVLLLGGNADAQARVGSPAVAGAVVRAEVVEHGRGEKVIVFRYKSKVRYRRKTGHRQALTRLRITDILVDGTSTVARAPESAEPARATAPAEATSAAEPPTEAAAPEETPATLTRRRRATHTAEPPTATSETTETEMPPSAGEGGPPHESEADSGAEPGQGA